jgi:multiple sugar transport system substrate-binding protein
VIFRANTAKFAKESGIDVRVDFVGWEDLRQQAAVSANTGAGPDIILGWAEDPHVYADKVSELTDVAEYLGKKYGGWMFLGEKYGKKAGTNNWIGLPFGGSTGPIVYRKSAVKEAGFDTVPSSHADFLKLCQGLKKANKPAGFALGNAVGDGNGFANWLIWSHGGYLVDEGGKGGDQQQGDRRGAEVSQGPLPDLRAGHDVVGRRQQQPRLRRQRAVPDGQRRVAVLRAQERSGDQGAGRRHRPRAADDGRDRQAAAVGAGAERHGVQHSKFQNGQGLPHTYMMEAERYDTWLTGCLGYWAHPLKAYNSSKVWDSDPRACGLSRRHEQRVLDRLQGTDLAGRRHRRRRIHPGADVRLGGLGPGDAGGRRQGSRPPRPPLLPLSFPPRS